MPQSSPKFFASGAAFRAWLARHHGSKSELLVGLYKKGAARAGMTYQDALDAALAYGWIDGVRRRLDDERWTIRFTPRQASSIWSNINTRRVEELKRRGLMAPPGLKVFAAREARRAGVYLHERAPLSLDAAGQARLAAHPAAKAFLDAQPPGYRRLAIGWVMNGKKPETRERRLQRVIDISARQRRIDFMKRWAE